MNRLWVRFSAMIAGVLFLVFFLQFLSIIVPHLAGWEAPELDAAPSDAELTRRLLDFLALSMLIGIGGGVVIGRRVSAPITELARAAHRIGQGDLEVHVPVRGSREIVELASTFNKMAADLRRAETLRRNLMADVSHELRTPLAVLEANLRAALDHVATLDETEVANLYGQTRHLSRLVNDLRELALAESHQLPLEQQPTDLSALLAETLQILEPMAEEKGIQLIDRARGPHLALVDPVRTRQVLFNLLSNALRHTPPGGEVAVSIASGAGEVRLEVQDSGEGLSPDQLASVFDRFYRADRSRSRETGGAGLGLAIVKAIAEAHGGRVEARSAGKGQGSTFSVTLPADRA